MKVGIHPHYNQAAQVTCVCGNKFTVGSTQDVIHVELCSKCHPFYTGEQRFVDTASRIQKFQKKQEVAAQFKVTIKAKVDEKKRAEDAPKSLREMLMGTK
jgi:large subunit ribosomal protein L31